MKTTIYFLLILACISSSWFTKQGLFAQNVGINVTGATAHPSALLDLDASSSPSVGLLVPRISLSLTTLPAPVTSPANSLLVYNLATTSGTAAVSPGFYYWDGTKWVRLQTTNNTANDWNLLGNSGTTAGTNFLGTTDNQDLVFKRNNIQAGLINSILQATSFGENALSITNTGLWNSAFGVNALSSNTTGLNNSAFGAAALFHTTSGSSNSGFGVNSLAANISGANNTAIGYGALGNLTTGTHNAALGFTAGYSVTTGSNNTLIGNLANVAAGTFTNSTALGYNAQVGQSNALILGGTGTNSVNVGIGTTTPNVALHIGGDADVLVNGLTPYYSTKLISYPTAAGIDLSGIAMSSDGNAVGANTWPPTSKISFFSSQAHSATTKGTDILFGTTANNTNTLTEVMRITNNGNIGIGTATPSEKLEIQGSVKIVDGTQAAGRVLVSDANGKGSWANGYAFPFCVIKAPIITQSVTPSTDFRFNGAWWVDANSYNPVPVVSSSGVVTGLQTGVYQILYNYDIAGNEYYWTRFKSYDASNTLIDSQQTLQPEWPSGAGVINVVAGGHVDIVFNSIFKYVPTTTNLMYGWDTPINQTFQLGKFTFIKLN